MDITTIVREHVITQYAPDLNALPTDFDLLENAVVDSLGMVRLLAWLGDRFDLPMDELDLDPNALRSVDQIAAFVRTNRAA